MSSSEASISTLLGAEKARPPPKRRALRGTPTVWHRKSKQGCRTCKIRKVKCDELRPLCRNCARRFPGIQNCDFAPPAVASSASSQTPIPQSLVYRPNHVHESSKLRMLELRLIHHYTRTVQNELPDHDIPQAREMWDLDIPRMAFSSELVLNALLALSALHRLMITPQDPDMYSSVYYFGRAMRSYRLAVANAPANAEPLLVTAMLVAYYAWLVSYCPTPGTPYVLPLQSFYSIRGVFDLLPEIGQDIKSPNLQWLFDVIPPCNDTIPPSTRFLAIWHQDCERFARSFEYENTLQEEKDVYIAGLAYLNSVCYAIMAGKPQVLTRRMMAFMVPSMPTAYLDMLGKKDPRAMAIMSRNLAMFNLIDHVWWLNGPDIAGVEEYHVRGICELMPVEWLWAMDWPLRVASGKLGLNFEEPISPPTTQIPRLPVRLIEHAPPGYP